MLLYHEQGNAVAIVGWHEGLAGQLHALLDQEGVTVRCFINDCPEKPHIENPAPRAARRYAYPEAESFKDLPLLTCEDWPGELVARGIQNVLLASADNALRQRMWQCVRGRLTVLSYVHSTAQILPEAMIDPGCMLLTSSVLGYRAELRAAVVLNTACQVDHHTVVEQAASVMPGAVLCGNVHVGERALIGAGAIVRQKANIGPGAVVGAGAVVVRDIPPDTTVVGVPARVCNM